MKEENKFVNLFSRKANIVYCSYLLILLSTDFHLGILAGDEECYELYAELFDPVIEEYHNGFKKTGLFQDHL